jgi:hypothetical protein
MIDDFSTPMLDKAEDEELTTYEVAQALRELGRLNASSPPKLEFATGNRDEAVIRFHGGPRHTAERVEDALVSAADRIRASMADVEFA